MYVAVLVSHQDTLSEPGHIYEKILQPKQPLKRICKTAQNGFVFVYVKNLEWLDSIIDLQINF